ncbi:polysaccharide export protein [Gilliamella sp. B2776]|uniref:polysaccharide biosynthesis/export family protein n=1 Tax=unclassified Gilliamella TaxID=2685620 RepID=UPI00226A84EF|nr:MULTISPECIES: polysaccharide biosynthesis/export family protein [unclassified Gilliamella]MCX8650743.1 polysaccharide export protein [Gilliamella sp. B2779]MCX8654097.1 polysaccharide export protein [Gilliamella sp. B2737]MCX8665626.1 polysaccharide export protein [Gilliamella sp. B2887]MCX8692591.1 polysaccharide export protein [Gilliamella sp. B2776]MCX8698616.1 polysaccharide export protein [Gilliamella sp. B3000]
MKLPSLLPIALAIFLSGCSVLPHSGPSFSSIKNINKQDSKRDDIYSKVNLVDLNDSINFTKDINSSKIPIKFINETTNQVQQVDRIGKGDSLKISIIETPPAILFTGSSDTGAPRTGLTDLPIVTVDSKGLISLPFVGVLKVDDKNPSQVQNEIVEKLSGIANRPQIIITVLEKRSSTVTVIGDKFSGKMTLTAKGEQLLDAVAMLGNNMYDIKDTLIQVTRNKKNSQIPLSLILSNPQFNIQLQQNDVITLVNKPSSFISMGATGATKEVAFEAVGINLSQALGRIGGLNDNKANAKGVFVFRYQDNLLVNDKKETIPTVFQIDLTNPNSFFIMKNFQIQNNDIVYVASAPIIELQKFLYAVFSPGVGMINQVSQVTE